MVDVTPKEPTHRRAIARCKVFMRPRHRRSPSREAPSKGDVLAVARVAGIQAAKRTPTHPAVPSAAGGQRLVNFDIERRPRRGRGPGRDRRPHRRRDGGAHACSVAALTIYDMCKSADRAMVIGDITLWEKTGGRSGTYRRRHECRRIVMYERCSPFPTPIGRGPSSDVTEPMRTVNEEIEREWANSSCWWSRRHGPRS
jgi:cyclic pyranopterin monophosphate synthase